MPFKKGYKKLSLVGLGVGLVGAKVVTGAMPNPTGSAAVTTIKGKAAEGFGKVGSKLPILGRIKGVGMVLKSTEGLTKAHKMFTGKKKRRDII